MLALATEWNEMPRTIDHTGVKYNHLTGIRCLDTYHIQPAGHKIQYWLWHCDACNGTREATPSQVRANKVTHCGCLKKHGLQALQYQCYCDGKYHLDDITFESFVRLSQLPCFYCGRSDRMNHREQTRRGILYEFDYHGLNRKDNSKGHTLDNCVQACWTCNNSIGKMNHYEYIVQIRRTYQNTIDIVIPCPFGDRWYDNGFGTFSCKNHQLEFYSDKVDGTYIWKGTVYTYSQFERLMKQKVFL